MLTASATSIGEPSGTVGGWLTVNSPRTSTGWEPSGVCTMTGRPSASSKKSSVVGPVGLAPVDLDLERDGRGHRVRAGHRPPPAEDVELAVRHLRGVAEHHRHLHPAEPTR